MYYVQKLPGIAEESSPSPPVSAEKVGWSDPLSFDISPLPFFVWNFFNEDICADDSKTIKEALKDAILTRAC